MFAQAAEDGAMLVVTALRRRRLMEHLRSVNSKLVTFIAAG